MEGSFLLPCPSFGKGRDRNILVDMGEDYEAQGKDDSSNSSSSVYFGV